MPFLAAVLSRFHIFCLGFAVSGLCVVLAGLLAAYPHSIDLAGEAVPAVLARLGD